MAIMYYMRDGAPPGNVTRSQDVSLQFIGDEFFGSKMRFLSPLSEIPAPFNPETGPADRDSQPIHVVLKITESEAGTPDFDKPGYYLVEGALPGW